MVVQKKGQRNKATGDTTYLGFCRSLKWTCVAYLVNQRKDYFFTVKCHIYEELIT